MTLEILFVGLQERGTSLALALAEANVDADLIGFDFDTKAARSAKQSSAVSDIVMNPYKAARTADVIVVTLPAAEAEDYIHDVAKDLRQDAILMDGSPLKTSNLRWAADNLKEAHYIGIVPIVQYEALFKLDTDYQDARADLFQQSLLGLVIAPTTPERAIQIAVNIADTIGSEPFFIDASELDAITSLTDTLPAALALSLFETAAGSRGWPDIQRIAGRDFLSTTTSLETSRAESLAKKFIDNRQSLSVHLDQVIERLQRLRQIISDAEQEELAESIDRAVSQRQSWLAKRQRADWEAEEKGSNQPSRPSIFGNLLGSDPAKGDKRK